MRGFDNIVNKNLIKNLGYLNGKFTNGSAKAGSVFDVVNPANGKVLTQLPRMGVKDVVDGTNFANDAFSTWKNTTGKERSKILRNMSELMTGKYRDDLAAIITLEAGKPLAEAKGEIGYAASFYELYGEEAKRIHGEVLSTSNNNRRMLALKQPVGPAALITPWNFPSAMITRKVGPALAAGCTVLIKPAEQTPLSALALCVIAEEAGVPPGVINCLTVGRDEVVDVGTALCHSKQIRKLSFTGSTAVGKWLYRECSTTVKKVCGASGLVPYHMQMILIVSSPRRFRWSWAATRRSSCSTMQIWRSP
jgi:acyl-CoA reductase-like NAD-dependent aldehyde dehydrogenase